jgi:hypothetical protein
MLGSINMYILLLSTRRTGRRDHPPLNSTKGLVSNLFIYFIPTGRQGFYCLRVLSRVRSRAIVFVNEGLWSRPTDAALLKLSLLFCLVSGKETSRCTT